MKSGKEAKSEVGGSQLGELGAGCKAWDRAHLAGGRRGHVWLSAASQLGLQQLIRPGAAGSAWYQTRNHGSGTVTDLSL